MDDSDISQAVSGDLPAPHFDDEATLISARRVVPIAAARSAERKRILRRALPLIATAGLAGIVVGLATGSYTRRRIDTEVVRERIEATAGAQPAPTTAETPAQVKSEIVEGAPDVAQSPATQRTAADGLASGKAPVRSIFPRVHSRNVLLNRDRNRNRGASHIEEIFAGSNP